MRRITWNQFPNICW